LEVSKKTKIENVASETGAISPLTLRDRKEELSCLSSNLANILGFDQKETNDNPLEKSMGQKHLDEILSGASKSTSLWATADAPEFTPSERQKFEDSKSIQLNPFVEEFIPRSFSHSASPPKQSFKASHLPSVITSGPFGNPKGTWTLSPLPLIPPAPIARPVPIMRPPVAMAPIARPPPMIIQQPPAHVNDAPMRRRQRPRPKPVQNLEPAISRMVIQLEASDKLQFVT
jgi:hypothetical protein